MSRILLIYILSIAWISIDAQSALPDIPSILDTYKNKLGVTPNDLAEYSISSTYTTDHLNVTHVYLEQKYQDIKVFNGILNLNLLGDQLVSFGNRWISEIGTKAPSEIPTITASTAVVRSATELGHAILNPIEVRSEQNKL